MAAKIYGVDVVRRRDGEDRSLTKTGKRGTRKPTDAELSAQWEACERSWTESCEARKRAGMGPLAWTRFPLRFQRALYAEMEARAAKPARKAKPKAEPKPEPAGPNVVGLDVFRMYRRELIALDTPEARAELARRKAKRARAA